MPLADICVRMITEMAASVTKRLLVLPFISFFILSTASAFSLSPYRHIDGSVCALGGASGRAQKIGGGLTSLWRRADLSLRSEKGKKEKKGKNGALLKMSKSPANSDTPSKGLTSARFEFFKNLAKRQGLSMGGCAIGLLFGLFLAYQAISFALWLASKVLGFGAVMLCSHYPMGFCYWVFPSWVKPALATFLLVSGVLPLLSSIPNAISGAECPTYVIKKASLGGVAGVDLREYEPFPAAAMETSGRSARERMQTAFGRLTGYVTSMNKDPQTGRKVNLGISGFLMLRKEGPGQPFKALLALPQKDKIQVYPTPLDDAISVVTLEATTYAGTTLEGGLPEDSVLEELIDAVQDAAEAEGLRMKSSVVICQVMGEFKTEVLIPVASEADVAAGVIVDAVASEDTSFNKLVA